MRTQVCIIGGGPAGLLLAQLLHLAGIDSIVLERRTRAHVLARIRAGVLEAAAVDQLRAAGLAARIDREAQVHDGIRLAYRNRAFRIDFRALTGRTVTVWGQTELTHDLYAARDDAGGQVICEAADVTPQGLEGDAPFVTFTTAGTAQRIDCDFVAGCDGFHGACRRAIPAAALT